MPDDEDKLGVLSGLSLFKKDSDRKACDPEAQRLIDEANEPIEAEDDGEPALCAVCGLPTEYIVEGRFMVVVHPECRGKPIPDDAEKRVAYRNQAITLTGQLVALRRDYQELQEYCEQSSEIRLQQGKMLSEAQGEIQILKGTNERLRRELEKIKRELGDDLDQILLMEENNGDSE